MSFKSPSPTPSLARMTRAWRFALWAALGAAPGLACAGVAGVLTTTVTTLSPTVTYATVSKSGAPLVTYIGYEFTTSYSGTNTTNNVQLVGELFVTDTADLDTLELDSQSSPSNCTAQTLSDRIRLTCVLGQLRSGSKDSKLQVFFKAPKKVDGGTGDLDVKNKVTLTGATYYAELSDGADNTNNRWDWTPPQAVELGTIVANEIKSVLPKRGGDLFSGNAGIANTVDRFASRVVVPNFSLFPYAYTTAEVAESSPLCANSPLLNEAGSPVCHQLDLTVNDDTGVTAKFSVTAPLSVKLSIDKTSCPQGSCKLDALIFSYEDEPIKLCLVANTPFPDGKPCLNGAPVRIKDKKNPDRDGDIEAEVLNTRNGRFTIA